MNLKTLVAIIFENSGWPDSVVVAADCAYGASAFVGAHATEVGSRLALVSLSWAAFGGTANSYGGRGSARKKSVAAPAPHGTGKACGPLI